MPRHVLSGGVEVEHIVEVAVVEVLVDPLFDGLQFGIVNDEARSTDLPGHADPEDVVMTMESGTLVVLRQSLQLVGGREREVLRDGGDHAGIPSLIRFRSLATR